MSNIDEQWWKHFVPECYFDTVLLKRLLGSNQRILHLRGCNNVVNELKIKSLKDDFAVALIDKDKNEVDYLKECTVLYDADKLILWKHETKHHFIIQLNPPLEKWVVDILDENGLKIEDFGYSRNYKRLKKEIKADIDTEKNEKFNKLVDAVIRTDCMTVKKMKSILQYLKEKNYNAEINELKNA